jgi:molybdopterin synthase catalytic subunit
VVNLKVGDLKVKLIEVSDAVIEAGTILGVLKNPELSASHGAEILFLGVVRNINLGRDVEAVAYDAFAPLAEKTLAEIADEARVKFAGTSGVPLQAVIYHRTGKLKVGEVSLAIAVSSRHRDEAYEASRYIIEEIKERAPIWKKEFYTDGESDWLKGHALCGHGPKKNRASSDEHENSTRS